MKIDIGNTTIEYILYRTKIAEVILYNATNIPSFVFKHLFRKAPLPMRRPEPRPMPGTKDT